MLYKTLKKGDDVKVTRDIDMQPNAFIMAGEKGKVVTIDPDERYLEIRLHTYHPGLDYYGNCIWSLPNDEEERLLRCIKKDYFPTIKAWYVTGASAALVASVIALSGFTYTFAGDRFQRRVVDLDGKLYIYEIERDWNVWGWGENDDVYRIVSKKEAPTE